MEQIILRDYQKEADKSVWDYWKRKKGNPLVVAPCGAGKTILIAELIRKAMQYQDTRVLVLTHRAELLVQSEAMLKKMWPNAKTGFFSAGIGEKDYCSPIIFAGIQSFHSVCHKFEPFDIVIVDEIHLVDRSRTSAYGKTLDTLKLMRPTLRLIGYSATPFRLDSGYLHKGKGALFDEITYDISVQKLVNEGYLTPVVAKRGRIVADMKGVKRKAGEFNLTEMANAFDEVLEGACQEIIYYGAERNAWMVFCASVDQSYRALEIMQEHGIDSSVVTGSTPKNERAEILEKFSTGKLKCLINVNVLSIGTDLPICDLLAIIRATDSTSLYVQIVGRAMRTHPGKKDALLLDFGGNVERHGPIDDVIIKQPGGSGDGEAPAKACPECHSILPLSSRQCPDCLYIFPPPKPSYNGTAFDGAVMASQRKPKWIKVDKVAYKRHKKEGKPDSVRVEYKCGLKTYKEWLLPEHSGRAKSETDGKLFNRYGYVPSMPKNTDELLEALKLMPCPKFILVKQEGKYERVIHACFGETYEQEMQ